MTDLLSDYKDIYINYPHNTCLTKEQRKDSIKI